MINRWEIDLGEAREEQAYMIHALKYLYVGDCDGIATIKLDSRSASSLNPEEFDKLTNVSKMDYLYITNTAQPGKKLVFYIEEAKILWWR